MNCDTESNATERFQMSEIQQSLFDESNRMEIAEMERRIRKNAFRVVFDFLERNTPVENTAEYWEKTCKDASYTAETHLTNELCQDLMVAAITYLSDKAKEISNGKAGTLPS